MTDREKRFKEITDEMAELYRKKNTDYGDSFHQAWKKFGPTVGLVYMDAKLNRIKQLLAHPEAQQVHSEKIDDTLIDLANYAVLTTMEIVSYFQIDGPSTFDECIEKVNELKNEPKDPWWEANIQDKIEEFTGAFEWSSRYLLNHYNPKELLEKYLFFAVDAIAIKMQLEKQPKGELTSSDPLEAAILKLSNWGHPMYPIHQAQIILEEGGIMPKKATDGSAGYDLFAPTNWIIMPGRNMVPLNFRISLPKGIGATPESRSGFTLKGFEGYRSWKGDYNRDNNNLIPQGEPSRMDADVQWGLIDSDYRGVCGVLVISREKEPFLLTKGTKFAQMCFQRYEDVDFIPVTKLDDTDRKGGFGHTGTK